MITRARVIIARVFRRLNRFALSGILLLLILQIGGSYILRVWLWNYPLLEWLRNGSLHIDILSGHGTTISLVVPPEEDEYLQTNKAEAVHT